MTDNFFSINNKKLKLDFEHFEEFNYKIPKDLSNIEISSGLKSFKRFSFREYLRFFEGFYSDLYKYNLLCKTLYANNKNKNLSYKNHLDIGSREGFIGMMLKGADFTKKSNGIDIYDFSNNLIQNIKLVYKILTKFNLDFKGSYLASQNEIGVKIEKYNYYKSIKKINKFIQTSLEDFNLNENDKKFDLISCISTLCYIDPEKFLKKLISISEVDSELYIYSDNYMFPINSSKVVTKLPYSVQRLTKSELNSFLSRFHKEKANFLKDLNNYYMEGNPISAKRLCKLLEDNNFKILSLNYSKNVDWALNLLHKDKENIIREISEIHGPVEERDLTSRFFWLHAKRVS